MKQQVIEVLMVEPGREPRIVRLDNSLESLQAAVSIGADYRGLIEIISLSDEVCILCNEEGKLIGLEPNRRLWSDVLCGVFYVTEQDNEGNLCSLSAKDREHYKEFLLFPKASRRMKQITLCSPDSTSYKAQNKRNSSVDGFLFVVYFLDALADEPTG